MSLLHSLPIYEAAGIAILTFIAYWINWELTIGSTRRAFIKQKGCRPLEKRQDWDSLFGLGFVRQSLKAIREHKGLENLEKLFTYMGADTLQFKVLNLRVYLTVEPENIKWILSLDFDAWSVGNERKSDLRPFLGDGILTTDGAAWHRSREMIRPSFVRAQIADLDILERHVLNLIKVVPKDSSTVDLLELFYGLTLDVATEFLFGESVHSLDQSNNSIDNERIADAFAYCQNKEERVAQRGLIHGLIRGLLLPDRHYKRSCKYLHDFVDSLVEKGLNQRTRLPAGNKAKEPSRHTFLDELASQTTDKAQIRYELLNLLLAGRDTTAALLSNIWFQLARRPDIYSRLRKEVDDLSNDLPTFEQIKEMKYLRALVNESLRLYPIVPNNSRQAIKDTILPVGGGEDRKAPIFVPKGRIVSYPTWVMHRRKDIYGEDAAEFKPSRWLDDGDKRLRPGWGFLPFNGGPRVCIGQQFALVEASYTTIRLMQAFEGLESRDSEPWREKLTLTCASLNGCKVALSPAQ